MIIVFQKKIGFILKKKLKKICISNYEYKENTKKSE